MEIKLIGGKTLVHFTRNNYRATLKQCQRLESEWLRMMTMVFKLMIAVVLVVAVVVALVIVVVEVP